MRSIGGSRPAANRSVMISCRGAARNSGLVRFGGRNARLQVVAASKGSVPLTVEVQRKVNFGECIKVVGNDPCFGSWELGNAPTLKWHDGDVWSGTIDIPIGQPMRFKIVAVAKSNAEWENGSDRELTALGPEYGLKATCKWNHTGEMAVDSFKLDGHAGNGKPSHAQVAEAVGGAPSRSEPAPRAVFAGGDASSALSDLEEQARSASAWVGGDVQFVKSKHEGDRSGGVWNTDGLEGTALELVKGDQKAANWLTKLDLVKKLLVDRHPQMRPGWEEMAHCFIYTSWINTGAIRCTEGGSHFRPNHHANLALKMFRSLEWVIGDTSQMYSPKGTSSDALSVMAARRMHSRLPSISGEFRQSVPLTRIRDIAHRSDIPHDVKQEIKHTLQNKLHRCAGPEDLIASEKMLAKITANPGEFNEAFVNEFKIFMKELREFFNASGLEDLLHKTLGPLDEAHGSAVSQLLASKKSVEAKLGRESLEDLMTLLFSATQVRTFYAAGLSAGLRNDVTDEVLEMRQRWRLCEIRLEEYCFVVLSRIVNVLEQQGGANALSNADNNVWAIPLSALTAGLRNLGLSQFKTKELLALENELQAWHSSAPLVQSGKDNALRAKASMDRVLRLTAEYSDTLMGVFAKPAAALGKGLGVPPHMSSIFGESEVRSSVAFQVSKLAALMSKALRIAAGQSAWDGLVTGEAVGVLREVPSLNPSVVEEFVKGQGGSDLVLVVAAAEGDEELGPLVPLGLRGVVLRQELPHLSHLGVRARQEKVTFATLDDKEQFDQLVKPLLGKTVKLEVTPGGVKITAAEAGSGGSQQRTAASAHRTAEASTSGGWSAAQRVKSATLVKLVDAKEATCGAKAAKCAELDQLAISAKDLFKTPVGCCLPFGSMEVAIAAAGSQVAAEFKSVLDDLERPELTGSGLDQACAHMQRIVEQLTLPGSLLDEIMAVFPSHGFLAVRSSANVEDLAGMSAAGLYESVVGVAASDPAAITKAVAAVWASLFTRRAVMSRRVAGVPQSAATMAVLIQELYCPKVSFVLHTARPSDSNANIVMVEAAPGQGETLAAATAGTPWRFEVDKTSGKVETLAFANFSRALMMNAARTEDGLMELEVDYSKQRVTVDAEYRTQVAQRLAAVGTAIETYFGKVAQDIEGGLVATDSEDAVVYIFQSRPQ